MALTRVFALQTRTQDSTIAIFLDETVYGSPELNRNQEAHFVVIAKMDENQQLAFISNIDNTLPLTQLTYTITQNADGAYRLISFNPLFYSTGANYVVGQIIYHVASLKFYKATGISGPATTVREPSITAGWATFWSDTVDFTQEVSNILVDKFISDDLITFRYEDCLVEELDAINDDILCGVCTKTEELLRVNSMQLLLAGANSNNWQNKQPKAEIIITEAAKKFCC